MISLVAKKVGMTHLYKDDGSMVPLTLVKFYDNCVVEASDSSNVVLMGYNKISNPNKVKKSVSGVFSKKGLPVHKKIYGFKKPDSFSYNNGSQINFWDLIKEGDLVSVSGTSVGKGFAGSMKRHNFSGLEASHGVSVSHRAHGSTGQRQDPGKVFKGKKMAGHMGDVKVTVKNLEVVVVDKENNILAVKGSVPGSANSDVILKF